MWQEVELLHSHLHMDSGSLKMLLMGDVQATGTSGPVLTHGVILDPGGEWTSEPSTKSTTSQSPTERTVALQDSMELRSALEIL